MQDNKNIEDRAKQRGQRHHQPKKQEHYVGTLAAISRLNELCTRGFLPKPLGKIETLHDRLHVLARRLPQTDLVAADHSLALTLAHLLTLNRNGIHPLG
jgi:hypothetical protein